MLLSKRSLHPIQVKLGYQRRIVVVLSLSISSFVLFIQFSSSLKLPYLLFFQLRCRKIDIVNGFSDFNTFEYSRILSVQSSRYINILRQICYDRSHFKNVFSLQFSVQLYIKAKPHQTTMEFSIYSFL